MKKLKIIYCIVLIASIAVGVAGVRFGKNTLNAYIETVKSTMFLKDYYLDHTLYDELMAGFSFNRTVFDADFQDNFENYYGQRVKIMLTNENDFDITVLGLQIKEGENHKDIHISRTPEKVVTVPANTTEPVGIWFRIISEGPERDETLAILEKEISLKLIYTDASNNVQSLSDAPEDILKYEWIR